MPYSLLPVAPNPITFANIHEAFGGPGSVSATTYKTYDTRGVYTFVVPCGITSLAALVVGPGGGGAAGTIQNYAYCGYNGGGGGGGGGGAVTYNATFAVSARDNLTITVGQGGTGGTVIYEPVSIYPGNYAIGAPTAGYAASSITGATGGGSMTANPGGAAERYSGKGGTSAAGRVGGTVVQTSNPNGGLTVHGGTGGGGNAAVGTNTCGNWLRGFGGAGTSPTVSWATGYGSFGNGGWGGQARSCWLSYPTCIAHAYCRQDGYPSQYDAGARKGSSGIARGNGGRGGAAGWTLVETSTATAVSNITGYISSNTFYVTSTGTKDFVVSGEIISNITGATAPTPTTAYVLIIGGDNAANYGPYFPSGSDYTPTGNVQRLTKLGTWEVATSPGNADRLATGYNWSSGSLSATPGGVSGGNIDGRLGDELINTGLYNQVRIVNVSVRGAKLANWLSTAASSDYNGGTPLGEDDFVYTANKLYERIQYAVNQSSSKSFTFTHIFYQGGEADATFPGWTTYANYLTQFTQFRTDLNNLGLTFVPKFISKTSLSYWNPGSGNVVTTNNTSTSAQQYIVENYTDVWPGPYTDYYGGTYRWDTPAVHFNGTGFLGVAKDWANAVNAQNVGVTSTSYFVAGSSVTKVYNQMTSVSTLTSLISGTGTTGASVWTMDAPYYVGSVSVPVTFTGNYIKNITTNTIIPPGAGGDGADGFVVIYSDRSTPGAGKTPFYCYYRGGDYVADITANANIPSVAGRGATPIKICQFRGAAGNFSYCYTLAACATAYNFNLYTNVIAAGFVGGRVSANIVINGHLGGAIGGYAYQSGCCWPANNPPKVTITVGTSTGVISGAGSPGYSSSGNGGHGMKLTHNTTIKNYGIIQPGGGGGANSGYNGIYNAGGGAGLPAGTGATLFSGAYPPVCPTGVFDYWFLYAHWKTVWVWGGYGGGWVACGSPSTDGWGGGQRIQDHSQGCAPLSYYHQGYYPGSSIVNYTFAAATYTQGTGASLRGCVSL